MAIYELGDDEVFQCFQCGDMVYGSQYPAEVDIFVQDNGVGEVEILCMSCLRKNSDG
jgi:hypothetical protein